MTLSFVSRKLFRLLITLWAVMSFVFIVLRLSGDPVMTLVPPDAGQDVIDLYRERYGFNEPVLFQYLSYLAGLLVGDFGYSFRTSGPAIDLVASRLPPTLLLGGLALVVAIGVGVPLGIYAAVNRNGIGDRIAMSLAVFGFAMPNFFFGILLILLFTLTLQWLPSSGAGSPLHLIMPVATLGLASAGMFSRFTRSTMLEVLQQPFIQTAIAKGLSRRRMLLVHALPNAGIPLLTVLGFAVGTLVGGAVVTETVFAWPGVGRLLVVSVTERDLAVVQLLVLIIAFTMSITNLLVDLAYSWLDPRIALQSEGNGS